MSNTNILLDEIIAHLNSSFLHTHDWREPDAIKLLFEEVRAFYLRGHFAAQCPVRRQMRYWFFRMVPVGTQGGDEAPPSEPWDKRFAEDAALHRRIREGDVGNISLPLHSDSGSLNGS